MASENISILVVEDEPAIAELVSFSVKTAGWTPVTVYTGTEAWTALQRFRPDMVLLDWMLPDLSGMRLLMKIREHKDMKTLPVIMLTAKTLEEDKVAGLDQGADDYITKPFSPSELTARVDAIYRRVCMSFIKDEQSPVIESGPFTLNLKSRTVTKNGKLIDLTQVEYQIMEYFLNNQNTALDRASILNHIWGDGYFGDDKIVDVNIRRIRMKIEEEPSKPQYITTIWGYGYKWNDK